MSQEMNLWQEMDILPDLGVLDHLLRDLLPEKNIDSMDFIEDVLKGNWALEPGLFWRYIRETVTGVFDEWKRLFITVLILFILVAMVSNLMAALKNEGAAKAAKTTPANLTEKIGHMMAEIKALQSENESLKSKAAKEALGDVMNQVAEVKGVKLLAASVDGVDMNGLRDLGDQLKAKLGEGVVVLASSMDGKVNLVAMATDEAMAKGAHAGNLIKGIAGLVGGGGGGRPNMAQAGGKNPEGIQQAIEQSKAVLEGQLRQN